MGRVINLESSGKERNRLLKAVAVANRLLIRQAEIDNQTRDLAAFVAICLEAISKTIDPTVEAWEKRGYWLKADRFRMEWSWAETQGKKMHAAVLGEDWTNVAACAATLAEKLVKVEAGKRIESNSPWIGAWEQLCKTR